MNIIVIASTILLSGLAVYNTACVLVDSLGDLNDVQQAQFNSSLFNYLMIFAAVAIIAASLLQYSMTKNLIQPVQQLIESTKQMKDGEYPMPVESDDHGEIGELTEHFNGLVNQLKANDADRNKLVSNLSHELRTPLTNLNGYLKALRDGHIEGDRELYNSLLDESKRITVLIEQVELLKEWGEISSNHYTEYKNINISNLVDQCTGMFKLQLEKKNIQLESSAEDCTFRMNAEGILQVLTNLIDNAVNYYEGAGQIILKGACHKRIYSISLSSPGPVIPDDEKDLIFERFHRMDNSRSRETGGSGLGLAIAKEIIKKHDGTIEVESEAGMNTFFISVPIR